MSSRSESIGRRAFLWTAALSGLAAVLGEWMPQRWVSAATTITPFRIPGAVDLPAGSAVSFTLPGTTIPGVLVRLAADTYAAFDQRCPHLGCPVQWSAQRARFECPCHKAVFEGSVGRVLSGPPQRGLRRIAIEQRGDDVWALAVGADEQDGSQERSA
ncbi:MAG: ubiquinol-cytochrome c reductase iron-sulfur subunit [Candidatus Binatia bacterium]